jgi:hypothetical protein
MAYKLQNLQVWEREKREGEREDRKDRKDYESPLSYFLFLVIIRYCNCVCII